MRKQPGAELSTLFPTDRRQQWWYILLLGGVVCAGTAWLFFAGSDASYREVKQLVSTLNPYRSYDETETTTMRALARLGPKAYPALGRLLSGHDTKLDQLYDNVRRNLPVSVQALFPARQSKRELSRRAKWVVGPLGPEAARALVGPISKTLARRDLDPVGNVELLRCLYWSIPDSPKAVATLRDWLSKPDPRRLLFGMKDADEIWPNVSELAPDLIPWLRLADHVRDVAQGLGAMGTNALTALPELVDAFDNAVAGHPPNTNLTTQYSSGMQPLTWNRAAAIEAIGNIGLASTEVLSTLERAWIHPHPAIRALSADAIGKLGPKALASLPVLLSKLDTTNQLVLEYELEAIGKIGPGARAAIPVLRRWANREAISELPSPEPLGRAIRWFKDPLPLPGGAAAALLEVAPEEAKGLGALIAQALIPGPQAQGASSDVDLLRRLRPLAEEIVPALEPALQDNRQWVKQLAALQILCLEPGHQKARAELVEAMQQGEPSLRTQAAMYFWRVTGDTNQVLRVLRETLPTVKDNPSQPPLNYAAELGPIARPFVPQIQALLTNQDWSIRQLAGKALRRIDPSALPPIHEGRL